jgi:hypothetical protein
MSVSLSSRGAGFGDLDGDGDIDVVILNSRHRPTILRNDTSGDRHWLAVRLQGVQANRDGIGSHVTVIAGELRQCAEVHSGRGYQSHWGTRLHFGLGTHKKVDRIEVQWMGGGQDILENIGVDRFLTIQQGQNPAPKTP